MSATLVVLAGGEAGEQIARIGDEHADYDRGRRRVLRPGDAAYPSAETIAGWARRAVAVVLDDDHAPVVFLDERRATSEPWIEDAFLRAAGGPC